MKNFNKKEIIIMVAMGILSLAGNLVVLNLTEMISLFYIIAISGGALAYYAYHVGNLNIGNGALRISTIILYSAGIGLALPLLGAGRVM